MSVQIMQVTTPTTISIHISNNIPAPTSTVYLTPTLTPALTHDTYTCNLSPTPVATLIPTPTSGGFYYS